MTEELLHYIWKLRLFNYDNLTTVNGEKTQIIKTGEHNKDAGPDFFNSKVLIGNTTWAGNIELHIKSKDWLAHKHTHDINYDNVILHVVYEDGKVIRRKDGSIVPTLELKNRIDTKVIEKYKYLKSNSNWIPCEQQIKDVDQFTINNLLNRLLVERLETKSTFIVNSLKQNNNNWENTFYHSIAQNFGFKVNAQPFELLAKTLPLQCYSKQKNNLFQLEALLFGTAGFLENDFKDTFPNQLKKEFQYLKKRFNLSPINAKMWKFLRLRPSNFPTIRIAQFARLIFQSSHLFSKILECRKVNEIELLFNVSTGEYWKTHYLFDTVSNPKVKNLGKTTVHNIIVNTIAPFLFVYGEQKQVPVYKDRAISFLEAIPAEKNSIINKWKELNVSSKSAFETQALLQLKNEYCNKKRCLSCTIGNKVLTGA